MRYIYELPIDMEVVMIISNLPKKLAELSQQDEDAAIRLIQAWGEGEMDVEAIWNDVHEILGMTR